MGLEMVSVLLAAYNGERYLPEQIASLQAQTADFRVLWQDDGSTDGTPALLTAASEADGRFLPGMHQGEHLGAVGNFLSLMAQDDAPYTALCDQDDRWRPDKLARCLKALQMAEAECGADMPLLVHSDCRLVDGAGKVLHGSFFAHQHWEAAATDLPRLLVQNNVTGCTLMMNAALRDLAVAHAAAGRLYMHDWFIALTAAAFGRVIFLPAPLVDYRQHGTNAMGASRHGLLLRAMNALRAPETARARIRLTYEHARMFRDAYGAELPESAGRVAEAYLATEKLPKMRRIRAVRQCGCLMQGRAARMGQMLFG